MTLAQVSALFDGERRYHDPKATSSKQQGTLTDLAMFGALKAV